MSYQLLAQSGCSLVDSWAKCSRQVRFHYQRVVQTWKELHLETHPEGNMAAEWLSRRKAIRWLAGQLEELLAEHAALELGLGVEILPWSMVRLELLEEQTVH